MTKLSLKSSSFTKLTKLGLLTAPILLASIAITGGRASANSTPQNTPKQTVNNTATPKAPTNIKNNNRALQHTNTYAQNQPDNTTLTNTNDGTNSSNNNGATKHPNHLLNMHLLGGGDPWSNHSSEAYKNAQTAIGRYEGMGLTYSQACGIVGVAAIDNPKLNDGGLNTPRPHGRRGLGIFRVSPTMIQNYYNACDDLKIDPTTMRDIYAGIINAAEGGGLADYQSEADSQDTPETNAHNFISYFYPDDASQEPKAKKYAKDLVDAFKTKQPAAESKDLDDDDTTGTPTKENGTYTVNVHVEFKDKNSGQTVSSFDMPVNPFLLYGYDRVHKNLSENALVNSKMYNPAGQSGLDGKKPFSGSVYFGNMFNQLPNNYDNEAGYSIPGGKNGNQYLVIKNGKAVKSNPVVIDVDTLANNPNDQHETYSQTDGVGNYPIQSYDSENGTQTPQGQKSSSNNPGKGVNNGNGNTDSANQNGSQDSAPQAAGSGDNGSGGGSGSGGKGAAAAAGAGGGAAGAGAAGGAAAGGGSTAGGAGGGTDGTAGGVVQGGNGNNNSTPAGPNNNVIIQPGTTTTANNDGANNNIVPEVPVMNNNDHSTGSHNNNAAYNTEANNDNAMIALIAGLAQNDQKNNGILADLINEDGNRNLNRQLNNDINDAQIKTMFEDQNNSLASNIQQQSGQENGNNQLTSMEHSYELQSLQTSMSQSAAMAKLESSFKDGNNQSNPSAQTTTQNTVPDNDVANQLTSLNNIPNNQPANNIQGITVPSISTPSSNSSSTSPANNQEGQNVLNQLDSELGGLGNQQPSQPTSQGSSSQTGQDIMDQLNNALAGIGNSQPTSSSNANNQSDPSILNGLDNDLSDITNQANMAPMSMSMQSSSAKPASANSSVNNQAQANNLSTAENSAAKAPHYNDLFSEQSDSNVIHPNKQGQSGIISTPNFQYVINNDSTPHFIKGDYRAYVKFFGTDPYQNSIATDRPMKNNVPLDY